MAGIAAVAFPPAGLALGGGGSRALAHLGVIAALAEAQIPIHCIAGTSVGAVVGAAYCAGIPLDEIMAEKLDVRIVISGASNTRALTGIDPQRQQIYQSETRAIPTGESSDW